MERENINMKKCQKDKEKIKNKRRKIIKVFRYLFLLSNKRKKTFSKKYI